MELGVCLDLDGTMVRPHDDWDAWSSDLRRDLAVRPDDAAAFDGALARSLRAQGPVTLADACAAALGEVGRAAPADVAAIAARASARHAAAARLAPHADDVLEALERLGVPFAIVADGPDDMQRDVLRATGLDRRAHVLVVSGAGDVAVRKPHPKVFWLATTALGVRPADALMVGDDLRADVLGAHRFGMATCWLAPPAADASEAPAATVVVGTLAEAAAVIREFARH
jgi:HAD superfamily hydrolase (TIGR01509 family)